MNFATVMLKYINFVIMIVIYLMGVMIVIYLLGVIRRVQDETIPIM
jgi:hypothetical protein